jgi:ketopantoate reductase
VQELHAALDGASFEARIAPDIDREMWEKWILETCSLAEPLVA